MKTSGLFLSLVIFAFEVVAQHQHEPAPGSPLPLIEKIEPQPLMAQALRISEALTFIGNPLPGYDIQLLQALSNKKLDKETVKMIQHILDPYCLAMVDINPESRVKVVQGPSKPVLMQEGWSSFLLKVNNQAHVLAELEAESPNSEPVLHGSTSAHRMKPENALTPGQLDNRFLEVEMYKGRPLRPRLSGLGLEYMVVQDSRLIIPCCIVLWIYTISVP
jgi:hypothetical protein